MTENLLKRIDELSNLEAIRAFEFYAERVLEGMESTPEKAIDGIPEEFKDNALFKRALEMSDEEGAHPLPEAESVALTRELLRIFARDPVFAPSLAEALDEYEDNNLFVGEILATGVAVSMIIVAATTTFRGKIGKSIVVGKKAADANLIESLLKYFPKLMGKTLT
jgi:hypothetical protein